MHGRDKNELHRQTQGTRTLESDLWTLSDRWVITESPLKLAVLDVIKGVESGLVPDEYQNVDHLSQLTNIVLFGGSGDEDEAIREIGFRIIKEISGNYRGQGDPCDESCDDN